MHGSRNRGTASTHVATLPGLDAAVDAESDLWRLALDHAPLPIVVHDEAGAILALNQAFSAATGYAMAHLPDRAAWMAHMRRLPAADAIADPSLRPGPGQDAAGQGSAPVDVWTASGERRSWRFLHSEPFRHAGGRLATVTTAHDVTEMHRAEQDRAEQRIRTDRQLAELEALYAAAPVGLQMLDRDLRVVRINPALAELNGATVEEHVGRNIFDIVPGVREKAEPLLRRVIETGEPLTDLAFEGETRKAPGVVRNWVEQFYPVKDAAGAVAGVGIICVETTQNVADARRLEALNRTLQETLHRFEVVMRSARFLVFAQDRDRRYTFVSAPRWGRTQEEMIGLRDEDVLPPQLCQDSIRLKEHLFRTREPVQADLRTEIDGEEAWQHKRLEPVLDEAGVLVGLVGVSIDITERKRREEEVEMLMRELSHRSKNLLAVIQGMARHSRGRAASIEEFLVSFEGRLKSLADSHDILALDNWRGASIAELIRSQLGHYPELLTTRITWTGPPLVLLPVAAQNIGMALHELSTNALKYGALATVTGKVSVVWELVDGADGEPVFRMEWEERGGPAPERAAHRGFGRSVTEHIVPRALHGQASWSLEPGGLRWHLEAPSVWITGPPKAS